MYACLLCTWQLFLAWLPLPRWLGWLYDSIDVPLREAYCWLLLGWCILLLLFSECFQNILKASCEKLVQWKTGFWVLLPVRVNKVNLTYLYPISSKRKWQTGVMTKTGKCDICQSCQNVMNMHQMSNVTPVCHTRNTPKMWRTLVTYDVRMSHLKCGTRLSLSLTD